MVSLALLIDLHRDGDRQGPGGVEQTRRAVQLSGLGGQSNLRIADIGCGSGASAMVLAQELDAHVTAVDVSPELLDRLKVAAQRAGVGARVQTLSQSMENLAFEEHSLDAIWSEGAIYNMGFENGIKSWRRFLKPGGVLAVSELTWLTNERPAELERHWRQEYPEVATASVKIAILEANGYSPIGYFPLSNDSWLDNYYRPLQARFDAFLSRNGFSQDAQDIIEAEKREISLYERFCSYFGYGYYLAKKLGQ